MNRPLSILLVCTTACLPTGHAQEHHLADLPAYQTPVPYANMRNADVTQNLGPIGARSWIAGRGDNTTDSREILIKSIEPGSPADGILQPYDIITGAAVPSDTPPATWTSAPPIKPFDSDARLAFARAITWAETETAAGKLHLLRSRDGKTEEVVIQLPVLGSYSATSPFDCPKSALILKNAANFLATNMPVDGYPAGIGRPLNAALLLASGNDAYLDHARRSAMRMSVNHTITDAGHETWRWGNTNTFLCEYYLATGDERVLPTIREYCKVLADGQCNPGTWGHRAVPDFIPPGYGSLNSSGVICFLSLVLGKQCGVDNADTAIERSIRFYGGYAGRGSIPYGDHPPSYATTSNGKNGPIALAFNLLGATPAAQWFARLCASSDLVNLEGGHSGNYFNVSWSPLGAALAGNDNFSAFRSRFHSYYDLCRRSDGSFITQPLPHTREGDLGTGNYVSAGPMWTTGGYALGYLAGTERLAILGRTDSVFAANPPAELAPALALYRSKDFAASAEAAAAFNTSDNPRARKLAAQLAKISLSNLNSLKLTLADMARALEANDLYQIKYQLQAIESIIDPQDQRLTAFRTAIAAEGADQQLTAGKAFYDATTGVTWAGMKGYEIIAPSSQVSRRDHGKLNELSKKGTEPYRSAAANFLKQHPAISTTPDTTLVPVTLKSPKAPPTPSWRISTGKAPSKNWMDRSFSDRNWDPTDLPSSEVKSKKQCFLRSTFTIDDPKAIRVLLVEYQMAKTMAIYLNGEKVADVNPTNGATAKGKTPIQLKPACLKLLKKGTNTLAVAVTPGGPGFDLQLTASVNE